MISPCVVNLFAILLGKISLVHRPSRCYSVRTALHRCINLYDMMVVQQQLQLIQLSLQHEGCCSAVGPETVDTTNSG
jgi:hypothetical protein